MGPPYIHTQPPCIFSHHTVQYQHSSLACNTLSNQRLIKRAKITAHTIATPETSKTFDTPTTESPLQHLKLSTHLLQTSPGLLTTCLRRTI